MKFIKANWKWIAAVASVLLAALLLFLFLLLRGHSSYAVIYSKGGESLRLATSKGQIALQPGESRAQWFSPDGKRLYYDADDTLFLCEVQRGSGGMAIASGVSQWAASDGFVVYIERQGSRLQCYDSKRGATQAVASGAQRLYAANGQSVFLFTKLEGEDEVLFRCKMGGEPERMTGAVKDIRLYSGAWMELFYLASTSPGEQSLYMLTATGGAKLIERGVTEVFWDSYQPGGNLYFLKRGQRQAAPSIEIDDPQAEPDAAMKEPNQKDFPRIPVLDRWLGDGGYSDALEKWRKKQERDQVRAAAEAILEDLPGAGGGRDCYVYDGQARRLAMDIRVTQDGPDAAALRGTGYPAMVYKKEFFETAATRRVGLGELAAAMREGGSEAVREALAALLDEEGTEDLGYTLVILRGETPDEVPLEHTFGRGRYRALFLADELIYLERDTAEGPEAMYAYTLTEHGVSERRLLDTHARDILATDRSVYYHKNRDLMLYSNGANTRLLQNAAAYLEGADGTLYILGNLRDDAGTLYSQKANTQKVLAEQVKLGGVAASRRGAYAAWLANWSKGAGELYIGKRLLDSGVTEIILVR